MQTAINPPENVEDLILIHPGDFKTAAAAVVSLMSLNWVPSWNKRAAWVTSEKILSRTNFLA